MSDAPHRTGHRATDVVIQDDAAVRDNPGLVHLDAYFTLLRWEACIHRPGSARQPRRFLRPAASSRRRCRSRQRCSKLNCSYVQAPCARSARKMLQNRSAWDGSASCDDAAPRRGRHLTVATSPSQPNHAHWRRFCALGVRPVRWSTGTGCVPVHGRRVPGLRAQKAGRFRPSRARRREGHR